MRFSERIARALRFAWRTLDFTRRLVLNLLFLLVVLLVLALLLAEEGIRIPSPAALVVDPQGELVEEITYVPPAQVLFREGIDEETRDETPVRDLVEAIDLARDDARIRLLFLDVERLAGGGLSKLQQVASALQRFRESGKPIAVAGTYFTQDQYFLAAQADDVYLSPMGGVLLEGYDVYRTFLRSALEKLKVHVHAVSVGEYKSALEPLLRDDMSPAARQDNLAWLRVLWQAYIAEVERRRGLGAGALDAYVNDMLALMQRAGGDAAALALSQGLVDTLRTREEVRQRLVDLLGKQDGSFPQVRWDRYLQAARPRHRNGPAAKIGVVVARGVILPGKQRPGRIGGESTAALLRRAREDEEIRAVVLRIDSGGGSAVASEDIRREVTLTQAHGKPVVASLSSVAASGGYWIAAPANEIWAAPTTLTGSIGIFGVFPTFERTLEALGVHVDGVGTTRLSGALDPRRPLDPMVQGILEAAVAHGYRQFLHVVAEGRHMSPEQVDAVAQGRVWPGSTAQEIGLVDHLGELHEAIGAAARLAGLDHYGVRYVTQKPTAREQFLQLLTGPARGALAGVTHPLLKAAVGMNAGLDLLALLDDPQGTYAWCLWCPAP
ncbi:MAG: signal peptide peptidase SppA [Candidatus Latescibacterota bacterium]